MMDQEEDAERGRWAKEGERLKLANNNYQLMDRV